MYGDKVIYIRNNKNLGPAISRNIGIQRASGYYITFLDSDDLYYFDKLQLQVSLLNKNNDSDFCYGNYATTYDIFDTNQYTHDKFIAPKDLYPQYLLPNRMYIVTPAVMLRAGILKKIGWFDTSMRICEDLELWSRVLIETNAVCVTRPIVAIHLRKEINIDFKANILARDQLYERIMSRDHQFGENFKKRLYTDLVDLYLSIALKNSSAPEIINSLESMRKSSKKSFEIMRSDIVKLANEMVC